MTGEEMAGPAAPKVVRLLYFVGAGFISVIAINKWRDLQRKSVDQSLQIQQNQHQQNQQP